LLATLFAPRLAEHYGWQATFGIAILPLALLELGARWAQRWDSAAVQRPVCTRYRGMLVEADDEGVA
jgi:MFS transporter, NNP family, nitrate/nitrite transporter